MDYLDSEKFIGLLEDRFDRKTFTPEISIPSIVILDDDHK
jgi:hypothetical protein